ncbi:MAG: hypothetical protein IIX60_01255 [Clostridia bacterium]|nr:hypothetical protein [Clostridia bacterium]MBQ2174977.1 hypothetical protein [Alphaproteobacteria bacterium]
MNVFLFIVSVLVAVSAAFIVSSEYIFQWLRNLIIKTKFEPLITFIHCPVCLGWWAGLFVGLLVGGLSWWCVAVAFTSALTARVLKSLEQ